MIRLIVVCVLAIVALGGGFLFLWNPGGYSEQPGHAGYVVPVATANAPLILPPEPGAPGLVSWVDGAPIEDWRSEVDKREAAIAAYLRDIDPANAARYGFREGQSPALGWDWFQHSPVGFTGVPFVLLKTIIDLDVDHPDPALRRIARIWKQPPPLGAAGGDGNLTLDHLGLGPHPDDYVDGVALPPDQRRFPIPYGMAWENPGKFEALSPLASAWYDARLAIKRIFTNSSLLVSRMRTTAHVDNWEADRPNFGTPGRFDRVHFSCAACHVGRVIVDGRMKFVPGMPNSEVEAQNYSRLIMETAAALVQSGFDPASSDPVRPADIVPDTAAVKALHREMLDKARLRPESFYGKSDEDIARAKIQAFAVAETFPRFVGDLIALGVRTHFIYQFVGRRKAYAADGPDAFLNRSGQMDAFGIASGLVAIHALRPDNSFLEFVRRDNPQSPFFTGFSVKNGMPVDVPGLTEPVSDTAEAARRVVASVKEWAPPVPGTIDVRSVNWVINNIHANWDGNQGASSRALASGASATGDPRMVNVRIHEPLNPFINYLPPPPYPFPSVELDRARAGKELFEERCANCHRPNNETIYPAARLGVDANRTLVNSSVSRYGLAALVLEACTIYGLNNEGRPGARWCMPEGGWEDRLDDFFRDTPRRVVEGTNGYKADTLSGIWAQAPYLHNGSVPTLGQLLCPQTRPSRFVRGNLHYDEALVGFEWAAPPARRYSAHDTMNVREYDTSLAGNANTGHTFGSDLCPPITGLDPVRDREDVTRLILQSPIGDLLAYLKTL